MKFTKFSNNNYQTNNSTNRFSLHNVSIHAYLPYIHVILERVFTITGIVHEPTTWHNMHTHNIRKYTQRKTIIHPYTYKYMYRRIKKGINVHVL